MVFCVSIVDKLLLYSGFRRSYKDDLFVYDGSAGRMVQGLGQSHNADVLMDPPYQTPFCFPTRLLVECKCHNKAIGLPEIRNALGLKEDINGFEVVTEEILKARKSSYTKKTTCYPMKRYLYQVAVASFSSFTSKAIPFAQAHRMPLLSFGNSTDYREVRETLMAVSRV